MEAEAEVVIIGAGVGRPVVDGMAAASRVAVEAVLAVDSPVVEADSAVEAAADHGKRFGRIAIIALGFRIYLSYFCASLKTVHEKG